MRTAVNRPTRAILRSGAMAIVLILTAQAATAQDAPTGSDLRALRYYIQEDETAAIAAELRRLRIAFPDWTPPDDLGTLEVAAPTTEIDTIYAQIANGDLATARRTLQATRTDFPDWTPPADMIALLESAEAQAEFDTAIARRDPDGALRIALDTPELLRCNRINNTWRLAELEEATGDDAAAFAAYRQIVNSCSSESDVIATIEKADSVSTEAQLRSLISTASERLSGSRSALAGLQTRLLSGRGIASSIDEPSQTTTSQDRPAPDAPAPTAAPAPAPAPRSQPATPPRVVATVDAPVPAPVATPAPAPQSLSAVAGVPVASPLAGLPRTGDSRISQVRAAAQAGDFRTCAARSADPQSLDVAYERAWCVYNLERPLEALALFTSAASAGLPGTTPRDARYGMALALLKRQMTDAASRIAASTDLSIEQRRTVESIILDQRGVRAYQQEDYPLAIKYFNGLEALDGSLRRDLAFLRGYAYLNSGDRDTARRLFERLNSQLVTAESRAALSASRPEKRN